MRCTHCGAPMAVDDLFCPDCGQRRAVDVATTVIPPVVVPAPTAPTAPTAAAGRGVVIGLLAGVGAFVVLVVGALILTGGDDKPTTSPVSVAETTVVLPTNETTSTIATTAPATSTAPATTLPVTVPATAATVSLPPLTAAPTVPPTAPPVTVPATNPPGSASLTLNCNYCRLRSEPSISATSAIVGELSGVDGAAVEVLAEGAGGWTYVRVDGKEGWLFGTFVWPVPAGFVLAEQSGQIALLTASGTPTGVENPTGNKALVSSTTGSLYTVLLPDGSTAYVSSSTPLRR